MAYSNWINNVQFLFHFTFKLILTINPDSMDGVISYLNRTINEHEIPKTISSSGLVRKRCGCIPANLTVYIDAVM